MNSERFCSFINLLIFLFGYSFGFFFSIYSNGQINNDNQLVKPAIEMKYAEFALTSGDDPERCIRFLVDEFPSKSIISENEKVCEK